MKAIKLSKTVTASNDLDANEVRAFLKEKGIFLVNLLSAVGSGKTTMLLRRYRQERDGPQCTGGRRRSRKIPEYV